MEAATLGRILVPAKIENIYDLENLASGLLPTEQVRRVEVEDARVDTGATYLAMPKPMIDQLGFRQASNGTAKQPPARLVRNLRASQADRPGTRLHHRGLRGR